MVEPRALGRIVDWYALTSGADEAGLGLLEAISQQLQASSKLRRFGRKEVSLAADAERDLLATLEDFLKCRPACALAARLALEIVGVITEATQFQIRSVNGLVESIDSLTADLRWEQRLLGSLGAEVSCSGEIILLHGFSGAVAEMLASSRDLKRVFIMGPDRDVRVSGREVTTAADAASLAESVFREQEVETLVVRAPIGIVNTALEDVDRVFLASSGVTLDGRLMCLEGAEAVVAAAREQRIPVYTFSYTRDIYAYPPTVGDGFRLIDAVDHVQVLTRHGIVDTLSIIPIIRCLSYEHIVPISPRQLAGSLDGVDSGSLRCFH